MAMFTPFGGIVVRHGGASSLSPQRRSVAFDICSKKRTISPDLGPAETGTGRAEEVGVPWLTSRRVQYQKRRFEQSLDRAPDRREVVT
jgi:hypothetical protein